MRIFSLFCACACACVCISPQRTGGGGRRGEGLTCLVGGVEGWRGCVMKENEQGEAEGFSSTDEMDLGGIGGF